MRLLNAESRETREFLSDNDIPPYAILSHTWGNEEITFQMSNLPTSELKDEEGYFKLNACCQQAILDGYEWIWIDT